MTQFCSLQIFNMTPYDADLSLSLMERHNWEPPYDRTPMQFQGARVAPFSSTELLPLHIADDTKTAEFRLNFAIGYGQVGTIGDGWAPIKGVGEQTKKFLDAGERKGYLPTFGSAAGDFRVLEVEYGTGEDENDRHLAIAIIPRIDAKTWMSRLPDETMLRDLTLPGAHDAGTAADIIDLSRCQDLTIAEQLDAGVRYFDIRLTPYYPLQICHGLSRTGKFFEKDCAAPMAEFLRDRGPEETIVLCVNSEVDDNPLENFHDNLIGLLERSLSDTFQTPGAGLRRLEAGQIQLPLKELRGKIVLLRRYPLQSGGNPIYAPLSGIQMIRFTDKGGTNRYPWPQNSDTFAELKLKGETGVNYQLDHYKPSDPYLQAYAIQDNYEKQTQDAKTAYVQQYSDVARTEYSGTWFINFLSLAGPETPRGYATGFKNINARIFQYIVQAGVGRYGTLPLDFVSDPEGLLDLMIASNQKLFVR
ncbi:hypothetical protein SGCZBJ_16115 [Caulobacter zeae]|uniref:1-phosphatidylinositol phosphodiesterase n=2 Tax=Caulobacter zeae TaxID=2055137 RepID=A0A2N5DB59_9CAUL|nr:hypothetical protein SGCZBJ_16115 [Caulobacter zeae]